MGLNTIRFILCFSILIVTTITISQFESALAQSGDLLGPWEETTSIPDPLVSPGVVGNDNTIYLLGGNIVDRSGIHCSPCGATDKVYFAEASSVGISEWQETTSLPDPRTYFVPLLVNDRIYVIGGHRLDGIAEGETTTYFANINPDGSLGQWISTTSLPYAVFNYGATEYNGRIYLVGGSTGFGPRSDVIYAEINDSDGTLGTWITTTSLPEANHPSAAVAHNGKLYTLGGYGSGPVHDTIYSAIINADGSLGEWSSVGQLSEPLGGFGTILSDDILVLIGGSNGPSVVSTVTITDIGSGFDWSNDNSIDLDDEEQPRTGLGVALVGDTVYAIGGGISTAYSSRTDTVFLTRLGNSLSPELLANAGSNQNVEPGEIVTLDGSDSEGNIDSYTWEQISGDVEVELDQADTISPIFTAPDTEDVLVLEFELTVVDEEGNDDKDIVRVTITSDFEPLKANAGMDVFVNEGDKVTLDGSGSTGDIESYTWDQIGGTEVDFEGQNTDSITFTAPDVDGTQLLTFELTVSASGDSTDNDRVTVTVKSKPTISELAANAGPDQDVEPGVTVTLDGSDSEGDIDSYLWMQTSGVIVDLKGASGAQPYFTVPKGFEGEELEFRLTVSNSQGYDSDTVNIHIRFPPEPFRLESKLNGSSYTIFGTTSNLRIAEPRIDPDSLSVYFDVSVQNTLVGSAEMTLPKRMIDGIYSIITETGAELEFEVISNTQSSTKIRFDVPEGTTSVQILATYVVPEFKDLLGLIFVIGILTAISGYAILARMNSWSKFGQSFRR